jgi:hypothetical protein
MKSFMAMYFCMIAFVVSAQQTDQDPTESDSVMIEKKKPFTKEIAGFFDHSIEWSPERNGTGISSQMGFGFFYEGVTAGFFLSEGVGKTSDDPFFPKDYHLPYRHTGGFIGKSLHRGKRLQVYSRLNVSYGDIVWEDKETKQARFEDRFYIIKPEAQLSYLPAPFIQLYGAVGYRVTHQLHLTQLDSNDYNGLTFNLGIRLGYFYKPKEE